MIYTYRKQLLIILLVLLFVVGGFVFYRINAPHTKNTSNSTPTAVKPIASAPLSQASIEEINTNMKKLLTIKYGKAIYTANIRNNSYKRTVASSGIATTQVLIDVPEKKETYLYVSTGTNSTPNTTSQIHCASEADQMAHPSTCKELGNE